MPQVLLLWNALSPQRRLVAGAAALIACLLLLMLARMAAQPSLSLLYAGLDPRAAGEVVAALDARGTPYEVRGGAIHVPASGRDALRMALAAEGLPASGPAGYEILDGLSGFSTTAQMFDAAYLRAREGELARTILAMPGVRGARVHLAVPAARPFARAQNPSASVSVTMGAGGLSPRAADTLRHLVAAAVPGLLPEAVAVIDGARGLVPPGGADDGMAGTGDRAARLRANILRLVEARVGPGNAVVEVNVATLATRERIVERRFDPEGRVAIATDSEEESGTTRAGGANGVTVASNLPDGDAGADRDSSSQDRRTRERVNFEVSETRREIESGPGRVSRVDVAVLLDAAALGSGAAGGAETAEPPADLAGIEALVKSAMGFDAARGDTLTLRALPFPDQPEAGTAAGPGRLADRLDPMRLAQTGAAALVALVLGLFVARPVLLSARRLPPPGAPAALASPPGFGAAGALRPPPGQAALPAPEAPAPDGAPPGAGGDTATGSQAVAELRRLTALREEDTAMILRDWLSAPAEERS